MWSLPRKSFNSSSVWSLWMSTVFSMAMMYSSTNSALFCRRRLVASGSAESVLSVWLEELSSFRNSNTCSSLLIQARTRLWVSTWSLNTWGVTSLYPEVGLDPTWRE